MPEFILALDQGTTGTTASLLDARGRVVRSATRDFTQHFPRPGWVEHDAAEIWTLSRDLMRRVARGIPPRRIAAIGLTNQRETVVMWDPKTGRPLHRAIVWQDRRTAGACAALRRRGREPGIRAKTGLVLDAYFSATKVRWLLDHVRPRRALVGTIDSWLLWNLCGIHATDFTNASRTLLFDIHRRRWDPGLLRLFGVAPDRLPEVRPSAGVFGTTGILGGEIPVAGVAGDQQAALFGQRCVEAGSVKNTYGTGCFAVMNTGTRAVRSRSGLLTTLAVDAAGRPCYALEGSVFIAGAAVQWLRDGLKMFGRIGDVEKLARSTASTGGVYLVPAFVGLGAPWWDMDARGALVGLTRGTGRAEIARAALESIAYQTADVLDAMRTDTGLRLRKLRVDGGATANRFLMQFQADLLGVPVERPADIESTVRGAAFLAGQGSGFWSRADLDRMVRIDKVFRPRPIDAAPLREGWRAAVRRTLTFR